MASIFLRTFIIKIKKWLSDFKMNAIINIIINSEGHDYLWTKKALML